MDGISRSGDGEANGSSSMCVNARGSCDSLQERAVEWEG